MRRTVSLPLVLVLSLTSAVALLRASAALRDPTVSSGIAAANESVVRRFYDAVNDAIRTGDAAGLDAVVAAELVDHGAAGGAASGRDELKARLARIHTAAPDMRLRVDAVATDGDTVIAAVTALAPARGELLGLPVADLPAWGTTDILRLEHGAIVERWSHRDAAARSRLLVEMSVAPLPPSTPLLALSRIGLSPFAVLYPVVSAGPTVYLVEGGEVVVFAEGATVIQRQPATGPPAGRVPLPPGDPPTLLAGDAIAVPPGIVHSVRANGPAAASVIAATTLPVPAAVDVTDHDANRLMQTVFLPAALRTGRVNLPEGIGVETLATGAAATWPAVPTALAIVRLTLDPGGSAPLAGRGWALLHVETGAVALEPTPDAGTATAPRSMAHPLVALGAGSTVTNTGEEPATVLIIAVGTGP